MAAAEDPREPVRVDSHPGDGVSRSTNRMEAYADAVFAIAFTLPVLAIQLPSGGSDFSRRLLAEWPSYLAYGLAALVIGTYWVQHHFSGVIYRTTGHYFNLATVLFLAMIGFVAFPIRAFADNIRDPTAREVGAIFLSWSLAAAGLSWLLKWSVGLASGHVDGRLEPGYVTRLNRKYWYSTVVLLAGATLRIASWPVGLALAAAVTLYYLIPPETPSYIDDAPVIQGER
jgi:uncharacterized membrane protein